jgi:hypothetical protein
MGNRETRISGEISGTKDAPPVAPRTERSRPQLVPAKAAQRLAGSQPVRAADVFALQRSVGNRAVQGLLARRALAGQIERAWSDADTGTYPASKDPSQPATPTGGWNASNQTIGGVERIPIEGLKEGLQAKDADAHLGASKEGEAGKAIAIVPTSLKPGQPVEIFLQLHGHNVGYRERSTSDGPGMEPGSVRDVAADRIEQQMGAGGRNMIGILPQGTTMSGFGAFNADAYITEVWSQLVTMKKLPQDAKRGAVVLSGHSGAGAPITKMLREGSLPSGLGELALFDAINDDYQLAGVEKFLESKMAADVKALKDFADPSLNGGLDATAVTGRQTAYLAASFRFRGVFTPKYNPQKKDDAGHLMWQDPPTNKKPLYDETKWEGYGRFYEPLRDNIKTWIDSKTKGLDSSLVAGLRENYKVVPAGAHATHNTILGANNNLQTALSALPPAPASAAPTSNAPASNTVAPATVQTAPPSNISRKLQRDKTSDPAAVFTD